MTRMRMTCRNCSGTGIDVIWHEVSKDEEAGVTTMQSEKVPCKQCDGRGYTEYVLFSIDEATAILKYCGLEE